MSVLIVLFPSRSLETDTRRRPSGNTATYKEDRSSQKYYKKRTQQHTEPECPSSVAEHSPVAKSQTLSVLSADAETTRRPSGEMATLVTYDEDIITKVQWTPRRTICECPFSVATHSPVATSHTLSVMSADADTTRRPSGNTATLRTYNEAKSSQK